MRYCEHCGAPLARCMRSARGDDGRQYRCGSTRWTPGASRESRRSQECRLLVQVQIARRALGLYADPAHWIDHMLDPNNATDRVFCASCGPRPPHEYAAEALDLMDEES